MFGIKLQPWVLSTLFDLDASSLTDQVLDLDMEGYSELAALSTVISTMKDFDDKVAAANQYFGNLAEHKSIKQRPELEIIKTVLAENGIVDLKELLSHNGVHERSLERYFKKHVGLSPKFYCRIVRFAHILRLVGEEPRDWSAITHAAGFYDQSHFIRNFKEFTGKEPTAYGFNPDTMANFYFD